MPSFMLTVDLMWRWTPGSVVLVPAINSNKDFTKYAVSFAHCGFNVTLGSRTQGYDPGHKFKQRFHQINTPSFFAHCGFKLTMPYYYGLQNPWLWFRATFQTRISSHTLFNKLLTADLMWSLTQGSVVLFPAINSNKDFIKFAVFYAHSGFSVTLDSRNPGSKDLIPAINSNKDFIKLFNMPSLLLTVDLMWRWTPEPKVMIPAINPNKDFIKYAVSFAHCGFNVTLDSRTQGFDPGHKFKQGFHQICRLFCSLWI